jgi:hypothetical protein
MHFQHFDAAGCHNLVFAFPNILNPCLNTVSLNRPRMETSLLLRATSKHRNIALVVTATATAMSDSLGVCTQMTAALCVRIVSRGILIAIAHTPSRAILRGTHADLWIPVQAYATKCPRIQLSRPLSPPAAVLPRLLELIGRHGLSWV